MANDFGTEQTFATSFDLAQEYLLSRFQLEILYFLIDRLRFQRACNAIHDFVDVIITRGLHGYAELNEDKPNCYLFLNAVAQSSSDKKALRDPLMNILLTERHHSVSLVVNLVSSYGTILAPPLQGHLTNLNR